MTRTGDRVPVFPLSIWQRVHLGIDENGDLVSVDLAERNILLGGEPGAGKSNGVNLITAHGALSGDCELVLIDGKQVELGPWRHCAEKFIGPSITDAIACGKWLQAIMNQRYDLLLAAGLRKITPESGQPVYLVVIDEYAYFSATVGDKKQQGEFGALIRDLVARGRAAGVIVVLATQRPSFQIIDPSLRDLFGYRWAFRCTTGASSDVVLGHGWATRGYSAATIDPLARGVSWLLAEDGTPQRIKAAYLTDREIAELARPPTPRPSPPPPAPAARPWYSGSGRRPTPGPSATTAGTCPAPAANSPRRPWGTTSPSTPPRPWRPPACPTGR
jgi:S-DNA-T family DNA segregation ATPase FtsK/SpoIIIE